MRIGLSPPDRIRDRLVKAASAIAVLGLTVGGAYYFIAAVVWLVSGRWPHWSLRQADMALPAAAAARGLRPVADFVLDASPGLLALSLAGVCGAFSLLFDRRPRRR